MTVDNSYQRYSCQIALPGFGREAQQKLSAACVLIVGIGGLGCPAAQYLAASGIGTIALADADRVSISNLHRQILFSPSDKGRLKVEVAKERLQEQNPQIDIQAHAVRIDVSNVERILPAYDLVLDCSDNFETRYLLNDACVLAGKPLVYGAIYQYEGQVSVWNHLQADGSRGANYRDLFPEIDPTQIPNCTDGGVIPTLAGIIGCMQANEAIKIITGNDEILSGKLLLFDAQSMRSRVVKIPARSGVAITRLTDPGKVMLVSAETLALEENYTLIDVRETAERQLDNIGGLHIPLRELNSRIDEIPATGRLIFYCASGKRSAEAVRVIAGNMAGRELFSLEGGLNSFRSSLQSQKSDQ